MFDADALRRLAVVADEIDALASQLSGMADCDDRLSWYVAHAAGLLGEARESVARVLPASVFREGVLV